MGRVYDEGRESVQNHEARYQSAVAPMASRRGPSAL